MMLHKVSARRDRMWDCRLLYSKQFDKRLTNCFRPTTGMWGKGQRKRKVMPTERLSLVRMQPLAWKKKQFLCNHISHVPVTLTLSTPWMRAHLDRLSSCASLVAICKDHFLPRDASAERGDATVNCLSVCLSVTTRYHDHIRWNSSKIIITAE